MKFLFLYFMAISFLSPVTVVAEDRSQLKKDDFITWPRANVKEFGCFLEKEFSHKDKKFNCSLKNYTNNGDPCKNTTEYYEGPKLPNALAAKVNSKIESIELSWEHGDLQVVSVTMKKRYSEKELREEFKLPLSASIQDCSKLNTCIVLVGSDHMGAGDVDCNEK